MADLKFVSTKAASLLFSIERQYQSKEMFFLLSSFTIQQSTLALHDRS